MKWKKGKYGRFEFTITIAAYADNPEDAWNEAFGNLCENDDGEGYPEDYNFEEVEE